MKKKMVVTGGAGFIGSHIAEEGIVRGYDVVILDNLSSGHRKNLPAQATFIQGNMSDQAVLREVFQGAETVFHLAALISVPESMKEKRKYMDVNTVGMVDVLEMAVASGVKNFIFSSSAAVYGDNPVSPKVEAMLPEPLSPYALNKLDGEYLLQMYAQEFGLNAVALRYFNVFGPRQSPKSAYAAAVPIFFDRALKNQPITIYGDGEQTRDFVYVKDIVQANFLAAESGEKLKAVPKKIFNVASGQVTTIKDLVHSIIQITGSSSIVEYLPARPGDIKHSRGNPQKIRDTLGFQPRFDLERGLREIVGLI